MNLTFPYFLLPRSIYNDLERRAAMTGKAKRSFSIKLFSYIITWVVTLEMTPDERETVVKRREAELRAIDDVKSWIRDENEKAEKRLLPILERDRDRLRRLRTAHDEGRAADFAAIIKEKRQAQLARGDGGRRRQMAFQIGLESPLVSVRL